MTEKAFEEISDSLVGSIRETVASALTAAGLPVDWQMEGEMSLSVSDFANEVLVWLGGAAVDVAPMAPMAMVAA